VRSTPTSLPSLSAMDIEQFVKPQVKRDASGDAGTSGSQRQPKTQKVGLSGAASSASEGSGQTSRPTLTAPPSEDVSHAVDPVIDTTPASAAGEGTTAAADEAAADPLEAGVAARSGSAQETSADDDQPAAASAAAAAAAATPPHLHPKPCRRM
jgi:hypothetical protein